MASFIGEAFCKLVKTYKERTIKCVFVGEDRGALNRLKALLTKGECISKAEFTRELESGGLEILRMQGCHLLEVGAVCRRRGSPE